jgi:hypothetical protein
VKPDGASPLGYPAGHRRRWRLRDLEHLGRQPSSDFCRCSRNSSAFAGEAESMTSQPLNCDLHCHSICSDGLLPAAAVARRAAGNGVDLLALTDHDDLEGLPGARAAATKSAWPSSMASKSRSNGKALQIHMLGFAFDQHRSVLNAGLAGIRSGRIERARRMSAELDKVGIAAPSPARCATRPTRT